MAAITIRGLDDKVKDRLRIRASRNGRSMEGEIRWILGRAVDVHPGDDHLGEAILTRFGALGGVDLELPARADAPRAAELPS